MGQKDVLSSHKGKAKQKSAPHPVGEVADEIHVPILQVILVHLVRLCLLVLFEPLDDLGKRLPCGG